MILQDIKVYQDYMGSLRRSDWTDKSIMPELRLQTKERILLSLEVNAYATLSDKYPLWLEIAHNTISKMDIEQLEDPYEYNFRINPDEISLLKQITIWDDAAERWIQKEIHEQVIFEGNTHGYVKKREAV